MYCTFGYMVFQPSPHKDPVGDDDYRPPKFTGDIMTAELGEGKMPLVITTTDVSTTQGCYHLYNMLLAKKGSDIRIGDGSTRSDISKARKQIIMMFTRTDGRARKKRLTFSLRRTCSV